MSPFENLEPAEIPIRESEKPRIERMARCAMVCDEGNLVPFSFMEDAEANAEEDSVSIFDWSQKVHQNQKKWNKKKQTQ